MLVRTLFILCSQRYSGIRSGALTAVFTLLLTALALAQVSDEYEEMKRLETQADELIVLGDSHGASLSIGKAALMAKILAAKEPDSELQQIYQGTENLFRTQENGYRAIAIFEQTGGQPPAPKSTCQLLDLAKQLNAQANESFSRIDLSIPSRATKLAKRYTTHTQEWREILHELQTDFACS